MEATPLLESKELVFRVPEFTYPGWMTLVTYITFATCALSENVLTGQPSRKGKLQDYFLTSLFSLGGTYFTNWALSYINYPTRIIFKSCRVVPVMAFHTLVVGQRYSFGQYSAAGVLVAGIALFTWGDARGIPDFNPAGILLISAGLVCDAMTANLEERQFFRIPQPCPRSEVVLFLSAFGVIEMVAICLATGELGPAIAHSWAHWEVVPAICTFSVLGYITVSLILSIIRHFGAPTAEIVKSMRKVFQVVLSFLLFPKPLSWRHMVGGLLVVAALQQLQGMRRAAPPSSPLAAEEQKKQDESAA